MKNYSTKLSQSTIHGLYNAIEEIIQTPVDDDNDKLLFATLAQIMSVLYKKKEWLIQKNTSVTFLPAQAIALRILYTDYINDATSYLGNQLHKISNEVAQIYQMPPGAKHHLSWTLL